MTLFSVPASSLVICEECHAAVLAEAYALHEEWHQQMASVLYRLDAWARRGPS